MHSQTNAVHEKQHSSLVFCPFNQQGSNIWLVWLWMQLESVFSFTLDLRPQTKCTFPTMFLFHLFQQLVRSTSMGAMRQSHTAGPTWWFWNVMWKAKLTPNIVMGSCWMQTLWWLQLTVKQGQFRFCLPILKGQFLFYDITEDCKTIMQWKDDKEILIPNKMWQICVYLK